VSSESLVLDLRDAGDEDIGSSGKFGQDQKQIVYVTFRQGAGQPSTIGSKRADGRLALESFQLTVMLCCLTGS